MAPPRQPPELIGDAMSEILLRLPPEEPAYLVRTTLVCKPWRGLLSDPTFLRRYREFHRTPPLLGFVHNVYFKHPLPRFVHMAATYPFPQSALDSGYSGCPFPHSNYSGWSALDCRHGRALLRQSGTKNLVVLDVITGDREELHESNIPYVHSSASVLCSRPGCDHLDCDSGPFLVVFVGSNRRERFGWACIYSSEAAAWSSPVYVQLTTSYSLVETKRAALVGDEIYFALVPGTKILKGNLGKHCLSMIDAPDVCHNSYVLMGSDNGSLGPASIKGLSLYLWSRKVRLDEVARWVQCRVIKLETLVPIDNLYCMSRVIGFAEGVGAIFMNTIGGIFTIELKSGQVRKVGEGMACYTVFPFMSFYSPGCTSSKLASVEAR